MGCGGYHRDQGNFYFFFSILSPRLHPIHEAKRRRNALFNSGPSCQWDSNKVAVR